MKCYYEVLGVPRDVDEFELKKSYRKLALKWHPDKNLENLETAKEQFQLVQQAYEVLSNSQERAWYDKHREAILKGGIGDDYKDDSIDLFQYFSTSCFKGFNDDEKGFYTVYRNVFDKLITEDLEFASDESFDELAPRFGDSQSSYEDVVHPFYAYWQSYSTKRSFAWLDPYDIRDISNRRILRLAEKENKKVRDKAKRERNEQVRNLVAFIRKRDKRVQVHAQKLAERAKENVKKAQERQAEQLRERQKQLLNHKISDTYKFSNIESELKTIEANLAAEFGEEISDDSDNDSHKMNLDFLQCVACNKLFKTQKAFVNHENSKKHKDNVIIMKNMMTAEEILHSNGNKKNSSSDCKAENEDSYKTEISEGELISNSDYDSDELSSEKPNVKKKRRPKFHLNEPQMENEYLFPGPSDHTTNNDEDNSSEGELISDQELENESLGNILSPNKKKNKNNDKMETSKGDLISSSDCDSDELSGKKSNVKKQRRAKSNLAEPQMGNEYLFPGPSEDSTENNMDEVNTSQDELISDQELEKESFENILLPKKNKNKKKGKIIKNPVIEHDSDDDEVNFNMDMGLSKKQRKKRQNVGIILKKRLNEPEKINNDIQPSQNDETIENNSVKIEEVNPTRKSKKLNKKKSCEAATTQKISSNPKNKVKSQNNDTHDISDLKDIEHFCVTCKSEFSSKNKLFEHLRKSGHASYIPSAVKNTRKNKKTKHNAQLDTDSD